MGNYLNKIPNPFSATSGSGDGDDPSRTKQVLTIFAVIGLITSVFAGSAAAATVADISTSEPTYDESSGAYSMYIQHTVDSASSGDTDTIVINHGDGMTVDTQSIQVAMSSVASVSTVEGSSNETQIVLSYNEDISSTQQIDISTQYTVSDGGEATVSVANMQQSTTFQYSEPQGTVEVGNITTSDGDSVSPSVEFVDDNGTVVESASNISESYSTQLAEGNYTVQATADGYEDYSESFSVSYNSTTTVDLDFSASSTETATPTETETDSTTTVDYEVTVEDNGSALDSFDISLKDNDSDVASASVGENDSNTVTFQNLSEGDYTLEVNYTDSDGNETTYTESVSVDAADADNGTVSQTVDVADSSSDGFFGGFGDFSPLGGISDAFNNFTDQLPDDPADLALTVIGGFFGIVGVLFVFIWVLIGIRTNRRI